MLAALIGLRVRLACDVTTGVGHYPQGTEFEVESVHRGRLSLMGAPDAMGARPRVNKVGLAKVDFIDAWRVFRHSGRGGGLAAEKLWAEVFLGTEVLARAEYTRLHGVIRQGGIRLQKHDASIALEYHAPRLRTRW